MSQNDNEMTVAEAKKEGIKDIYLLKENWVWSDGEKEMAILHYELMRGKYVLTEIFSNSEMAWMDSGEEDFKLEDATIISNGWDDYFDCFMER